MLQVNEITEITINDTCYLCRSRPVSHRVKLIDSNEVRINVCCCLSCMSHISRGNVELTTNKLIKIL